MHLQRYHGTKIKEWREIYFSFSTFKVKIFQIFYISLPSILKNLHLFMNFEFSLHLYWGPKTSPLLQPHKRIKRWSITPGLIWDPTHKRRNMSKPLDEIWIFSFSFFSTLIKTFGATKAARTLFPKWRVSIIAYSRKLESHTSLVHINGFAYFIHLYMRVTDVYLIWIK